MSQMTYSAAAFLHVQLRSLSLSYEVGTQAALFRYAGIQEPPLPVGRPAAGAREATSGSVWGR